MEQEGGEARGTGDGGSWGLGAGGGGCTREAETSATDSSSAGHARTCTQQGAAQSLQGLTAWGPRGRQRGRRAGRRRWHTSYPSMVSPLVAPLHATRQAQLPPAHQHTATRGQGGREGKEPGQQERRGRAQRVRKGIRAWGGAAAAGGGRRPHRRRGGNGAGRQAKRRGRSQALQNHRGGSKTICTQSTRQEGGNQQGRRGLAQQSTPPHATAAPTALRRCLGQHSCRVRWQRLASRQTCNSGSHCSGSHSSPVVRRTGNSKAVLGALKPMMLKAALGHLAAPLVAILNACVHVGALPQVWAMSALVPIWKPGAAHQTPEGYRGIAVGTLHAKLYAGMLNDRITAYTEAAGIRATGQAGFRRGFGCSDQTLALRAIIERQRARGQRLYACFVDFKQAFDRVPRDKLWFKLERAGIDGWALRAVQALYSSVPFSVKTPAGFTPCFPSLVRVKQGCPLSPTRLACGRPAAAATTPARGGAGGSTAALPAAPADGGAAARRQPPATLLRLRAPRVPGGSGVWYGPLPGRGTRATPAPWPGRAAQRCTLGR